MADKRHSRQLLNKVVVSKTGKRFGEVADISFDVRTGELLHVALKSATGYCDGLDLERNQQGQPCIPFSAVMAVGDFLVVAEEDII